MTEASQPLFSEVRLLRERQGDATAVGATLSLGLQRKLATCTTDDYVFFNSDAFFAV